VMEVRDLWPDSIVAVGAMERNLALRWIEKLELFLYKQASQVVVLTPAFRENLLSRGVPDDKIRVIVSGVDLNRYSPVKRDLMLAKEWHINSRDFVIGYIGTFGMAHGLKNVLDAAELLQDSEIQFMLVGTGQAREELSTELNRRGLTNVLLVPAQAKERIRDFWGLCDVSLVHLRDSPLFKTVIPSKIFESMGMGLPVLLAAPSGEASRIVEFENMGLCVAAEDPRALADAAIAMKQNHKLRASFAQNSLEAAPRYSREKQSEKMIHALEEACYGIRPFAQAASEPLTSIILEQESHTASMSLLALAQQLNAFRGQPVTQESPVEVHIRK
jgi:colanic acid biosynthesis glycosyl transferase WcaI